MLETIATFLRSNPLLAVGSVSILAVLVYAIYKMLTNSPSTSNTTTETQETVQEEKPAEMGIVRGGLGSDMLAAVELESDLKQYNSTSPEDIVAIGAFFDGKKDV